MKFKYNFETAKNLVKLSLVAAVVFVVVALITKTDNLSVSYTFTIAAACCIVLCIFFAFTGAKCPYCGKRIFKKLLVLKNCPYCGRNLSTGTKGKKNKLG